MKKKFTILVLVITALSLNLLAHTVGDEFTKKTNTVIWNETNFDFGKVEQNKAAIHEFTFVNSSNQPVIISGVRSSCGCTVTKYDKSPILPGKKGEIEISYNSKRTGPFKKSVIVTLNNNEKHVLKIEGDVAR